MKNKTVSILICVEHDLYRIFLKKILRDEEDCFLIKGDSKKIHDLKKSHDISSVDVLIIRVDQSITNQFEFVSAFVSQYPSTKIVIITFHLISPFHSKLTELGAFIYEMNAPLQSLIEIIKT